MKRMFLIACLSVSFRLLIAQNIVAVEYFIDTDPGYGNGHAVTITPGATIADVPLVIDISTASEGTHTLFIRVRDENGLWSPSYSQTFYRVPAESLGSQLPDITRMEYFIDIDPGYGAGNEIPISPAPSLADVTFSVPLSNITDGPHTLWIRAQDENGSWSIVYSKPFTKVSSTETTALDLETPVYSSTFAGNSSSVSVQASGGTPPYSVSFYYRGIAQGDFSSRTLTAMSGVTFETEVNASMLDALGVEFYFKVTDASGLVKETSRHYIYWSVPAEGLTIPVTASGGTRQSYEIFSIPYALEDNLIASVFDELGEYDKSKWRLVRYQGGKNVDFGAGINRIELGNAYWFNRKEAIDINFSGGTVAKVNQTTDAVIKLEPGWNQIGNPFPFDVDWDDVLAVNADIGLIGNLKVFNPSAFHLNDESNVLKTWSGGFVHNGNNTIVEIKLPVVLKGTAGGRRTGRALPDSRLDQPAWFVPITVTQGSVQNKMAGIGMHPDASTTIDRFDDLVVPRFLNYLEFYARHEEFFTPKFSRDMIPTTNNYTWNFEVESNDADAPVTLSWDPQRFGVNEAELFLFDVLQHMLVNMRTTHTYQFKPGSSQLFKIIYGSNGSEIRPDITSLGRNYPNPFTSSTTIPFIVAKDKSPVRIEVLDVLGKPVSSLLTGIYDSGVYEVRWDGRDNSGAMVSPGIYLYRMNAGNVSMTSRLIKR